MSAIDYNLTWRRYATRPAVMKGVSVPSVPGVDMQPGCDEWRVFAFHCSAINYNYDKGLLKII
ncbi:MAG: hypothetical protein ABIT96_05040 [Ferruginibacter sp.]